MTQSPSSAQVTGLANLSPSVMRTIAEGTLSTPTPKAVTRQFAKRYPLRPHEGTVKTFERYPLLSPAIDILAGGREPAPEALRREHVSAEVTWRGRSVLLTQQQVYHDQSDVVAQTGILLGKAKKLGEGDLLSTMLAGKVVQTHTCSGGSNSDNPTRFSAADERQLTAIHQMNDSEAFFGSLEGSPNENTSPVNEAYAAIMPSAAVSSLSAINGFIEGAAYGSVRNRITSTEWGSLGHHRFFMTTQSNDLISETSRSGNPVFLGFSLGREAYAHLVTDSTTAAVRLTDPFSYSIHGTTVPMHITYKFASAVLNDKYIIKFRFTV